jgi:hypothetical protein
MSGLNQKMQERLDRWRKSVSSPTSKPTMLVEKTSRRGGKSDFGDVMSIEEWENEIMKSQTRR